jgi:hypothetical protein
VLVITVMSLSNAGPRAALWRPTKLLAHVLSGQSLDSCGQSTDFVLLFFSVVNPFAFRLAVVIRTAATSPEQVPGTTPQPNCGLPNCFVHPDRSGEATMTESRVDRSYQLFTQSGQEPARASGDRLHVLALTQPDSIREFTALIDSGHLEQRFSLFPKADRRHNPDRRQASIIPEEERRRVVRRLSERSALASRE